MQNVGQAWLVLTMTDSAFHLGLVNAAQFLPMLVMALFAGALIDRVSKRNLLLLTQSSLLCLALALALLVSTGTVRYWHVLTLALLLGVVNSFDMPIRQSYVVELVGGREDLMNAIALNSAAFNGARIIGPGIAGLVMATWGPAATFYLNALSFVAVIAGLAQIAPHPPVGRDSRNRILSDVWEGLSYVRRVRSVGGPLLLLGLLSVFAINFNVLVPVFARSVLHRSAKEYGFLMSSLGLGALVASLGMARRARRGPSPRLLLGAGMMLSSCQIVLSGVRDYVGAAALLALTGWAMMTFLTSVNTTVQLSVPDVLRGRVMSLYTLLLAGVTPFGAMFAGSLSSRWGAAVALQCGGWIGLLASLAAALAYRVERRTNAADPLPS